MKRRRAMTILMCAGLVGGLAPAISAAAQQDDSIPEGVVLTSNCLEHQAFLDGEPDAIGRVLPEAYNAVENPASGRPLLFVRALRCNVNGDEDQTTFGSFGIVVESPDGTRCSPNSALDVPPVCNWYVLSWVADDPELVNWLRRGSVDFPIRHVPHLVLEQDAFDPSKGGASFHFEAGTPASEPFTMDAITRERPGELRVRGAYWSEGRDGTVRIGFATDDLGSGDATGVVTAPSGTLLAELMGAEEASYQLGYSAIAAERWGSGYYRKQVSGSDEHSTIFEGSCSLQGTVLFEPGATFVPQDLRYEFEGEGVCTGKLNDTEVEEIAVASRMYGLAEGSCARAQTTQPGSGELTFPDREVLTYNLDFTYVVPETDFTWYGSRSGTARGTGTFRTDRTPPTSSSRCATPEGSIDVPMDITVSTEGPLVSD